MGRCRSRGTEKDSVPVTTGFITRRDHSDSTSLLIFERPVGMPSLEMMTRLFLLTIVLLHSDPDYAGWVAVENPYQPTGLETLYFDPETIQRNGNRATLWQLTDLKFNSTTRFLSVKTHKEFDCEFSRVRVLQVIEFSRQMGTGRSRAGYIENGSWQPVETPSANHALWKTVCGKR